MLAHLRDFGHRRDDAIAEIVGVRARVPHATNAVHRGDGAQQVGKVVRAVIVRIDRLPQQDDFAESLSHHIVRLTHDVVELATAFSATGIRHDAVRASIVAAALNRNPCLDAFEAARDDVLVVLLEVEIGGGEPFATARTIQQLRERAVAIRADHQRDVLGLIEQARSEALCHAAGDTDNGVRLHESLQFAESPNHARLRVLADGAGVHQNHVGAIGRLNRCVAVCGETAVHELRIGHVHLTAVRLDVDRLPRTFGCLCHRHSAVSTQGRTCRPTPRSHADSFAVPPTRVRLARCSEKSMVA